MATPVLPENAEQEIAAIQTDVKAELPTSNPWLPWSDIRAEIVGIGKRVFAFYYHLKAMFAMFFPNTSSGVWRDMWASFRNISPVIASKSVGTVTATGIDTSTISSGQIMKVGSVEYESVGTVDIADQTITITSLVRYNKTAIATCSADHEFGSGMTVTISGATETEWNDTFSPITIIETDRFSFEVPVTFSNVVTGSPAIEISTATVIARSVDAGIDKNQDSGVQMEFESEIVGVDGTVFVQFGGLTGGADADDEDDPNSGYNQRINETYAKPVTLSNTEHIKRTVMGLDRANTRVWVHRLWDNSPNVRAYKAGYMSVFFVRDGDSDIIPGASYVSNAKAAIMEIVTANVPEESVYVNDTLTPVTIDISISNITPSTTSMKLAIENQIDSFFRNFNDEGVDFSAEKLKGHIYQTWDSDSGEQVINFDMIIPAGNIDIEIGEIPMSGTVTVG